MSGMGGARGLQILADSENLDRFLDNVVDSVTPILVEEDNDLKVPSSLVRDFSEETLIKWFNEQLAKVRRAVNNPPPKESYDNGVEKSDFTDSYEFALYARSNTPVRIELVNSGTTVKAALL